MTKFTNDRNVIELSMNELEIFGSYSGLLINKNTTEGTWIGKLKNRQIS